MQLRPEDGRCDRQVAAIEEADSHGEDEQRKQDPGITCLDRRGLDQGWGCSVQEPCHSVAARRSSSLSFWTRLRNCSSVLNSAERKARRHSSAIFMPTTCAPMHATFTS